MTKDSEREVLISYLVASYNHENYIIDCLNSILADGIDNREIVIVDDGSVDSSVKVIQQWMDSQDVGEVRLVSRENRGVSATFNQLLETSRGKYVRIVASDDMVVKGSTGEMISQLQANPQMLGIVGDVSVINEQGQIIAQSQMERLGKDSVVYKEDIKRAIISSWAICGPAGVFSRNYQNVVGRYDEELVVEDWSMYLRLVAANVLMFSDLKVAYYRIHDTNTSLTKDVSKRLRNLNSQKIAGEKALDLFVGAYHYFLLSEVLLLKCKIAFLSKRYLTCGGYLFLAKLVNLFGMFLYFFKFKNRI
ncbi:glycosyltransferase [Bdellovibrio sp.]|uniref:glycosyltransferase n=1 Tax=Bdellovibrio sp. TaxID=28201 RepID=UPI0039E28C0A